MTGRPPAARIRMAPSADRDVPVTSWPAATSMAVNGRPIAPLAPARKMRVTVEKTTSGEAIGEPAGHRSTDRGPRRAAGYHDPDATRPSAPEAGRQRHRPAGRCLQRDLGAGPTVTSELSAGTLGPELLLGRRDRGARRLELRQADPVDRLAPPRRGVDDDPTE